MTQPFIEIVDISKAYPGVVALAGVSLSVTPVLQPAIRAATVKAMERRFKCFMRIAPAILDTG